MHFTLVARLIEKACQIRAHPSPSLLEGSLDRQPRLGNSDFFRVSLVETVTAFLAGLKNAFGISAGRRWAGSKTSQGAGVRPGSAARSSAPARRGEASSCQGLCFIVTAVGFPLDGSCQGSSPQALDTELG